MSGTASTARWHVPDEAPPETQAARNRAEVCHASSHVWVGVGISAVAAASLLFFYSRGLTNLYGDAIAHMEGARRLWDSRTPGYPEIGSVWLPLFHILTSPLTLSDFLWRTGLAGSLVSTAAFIVASWFLFRLGVDMNRSLAAGIVAAAGFVCSLSMLYLASTPLTEPLALMWSVLMVYGLYRYQQEGLPRVLVAAALAAFCGTLTRYEAWNVVPFAALFVFLARRDPRPQRLRRAALFAAIAGSGPVLWVLHNTFRYGNPMEFYNGPYSARAIYLHQLAATGFRYPTDGSPLLSARYYLEDLRLIIGAWPLELALLGLVAWVIDPLLRARRAAALLFLVSLPFYIFAMAHAAVPLYVPTLFPHTYYNLRYGIEMLPAVALLPSFLFSSGLRERTRVALMVVFLCVILGQQVSMARNSVEQIPIVRESILNTPCKSKREQAVTQFLRTHYHTGTILLAAGKWPCVMPEAGIPYRNTITENNRKYWRQLPNDAEKWVEWIIRGDGDPVDDLMRTHPQSFRNYKLMEQDSFKGEETVAIYRLSGRLDGRLSDTPGSGRRPGAGQT